MRAFYDTNVLVAAVTKDTDRSDTATSLLNQVDEGYRSVLNLMELRAVLSKKKAFERERIEQIEDRITGSASITFPDASDVFAADRIQSDQLRYPMDALILASARAVDAPLVTFDGELLDHGGTEPSELLSDTP